MGSTILRIFSARGLPPSPLPLCGKDATLTPEKKSKNVAWNKLADSGGTPAPLYENFRKSLNIRLLEEKQVLKTIAIAMAGWPAGVVF